MQEQTKGRHIEKLILKINGMTCSGCIFKIENSLNETDGIESAKVNLQDKTAAILYDRDKIANDEIMEKIRKTGYEAAIIDTVKKNKMISFFQLAGFSAVLIIFLLLLNKTGIFNKLPVINNSMGYGLLFIIGLLTSVHCIAMCGGINLSQSVKRESNDISKTAAFEKFLPGILYNAGRVISYTVIGGIVGAIGSVINISGRFQAIIIIIAGFFMIIMGINLLGIFPALSKLIPKMPAFISKPVMKLKSGNKGPFAVGLLNGLLPCGPLQSMQLYALSTGNFFSGALSMFIFSTGTVPLMLGFSAVSSLLSQRFSLKMIKASSILIIFLGITMLGRGMSLSGINLIKPVKENNANISVIKSDIQYVESKITSSSYEPIIVQKNIPVKWNIRADKSSLNGCNNTVTVPMYNITKKLSPGDNIIEFIPDRTGIITFTCWMGMITSSIKIVDDINTVTKNEIAELNSNNENNASGCSSQAQLSGINSSFNPSEYFTGSNFKTGRANIKNGIQYITVDVTEGGYEPNIIVLQKDIKTKWIINGKSLNRSNYRMIVPVYNARIELVKGENSIEFVPETDFGFDSWQNDHHGFAMAVNDINNFSEREMDNKIKNYKPAVAGGQNGGNCCGK